ncbi:hypothetical protein Q9887_000695 [Vibrio fluvialis]|nr:hypothetical protein [Vibrio fluvialis]
MALINCNECDREYSNKAPACPHCGCPTIELQSPTADIIANTQDGKFSLEATFRGIVDVIFGLFYIVIVYQFIWGSAISEVDSSNEFFWVGVVVGLGFIILIQKIIRAIAGTIGKAIQSLF